MRTNGTFQEIYGAAKAYTLDVAEDGCPINPVVRREDGIWMLESGLEPTSGDFEVDLEVFDNWFWEGYEDDDYSPSESDIEDFVRACQE